MVLCQLHHRIRALEGEQKRLERALDSKDIMIRNLWDEMKLKDKRRADNVSTLFVVADTFDTCLEDLETVVPPKTPELVSITDLDPKEEALTNPPIEEQQLVPSHTQSQE